MKLTVDNKSFADAVAWVTKNYDHKNSNAYVALVVTEKGEAHLFHANPTSFLKSPFKINDADISKSELTKGKLAIALDGRYLTSLATAISGNKEPFELTHTTDGNEKLNVVTKNGRFTVPLMNVRTASEPEVIPLGEVDNRDYFDTLQRLSKLCDSDNAGRLPALGAVDIMLNPDDEKIVMMATDRYALGEIEISFEPSAKAKAYVEENGHILLPVEDAVLVNPSKGLTSSTTLIYENKGGKFGYSLGDGRIGLFSLKEADPLLYQTLKTKASENIKNSVTLNVAELKQAIGSISNLAWDETTVFFDITSEGMTVTDSTRSNKVKVATDDITVDQDYSIAFIRSFINESFSPISTSKMKLKWLSEKSAFIIEPTLDDGTALDNVFVFVIPSV